jgi:hypothetical protein
VDLLTRLRVERDRAAGAVLVALGAVALLIAYLGVSNSPYLADEMSYVVSGGLGGLFLLGIGATLLISAGLRDEWRKLDRLEEVTHRHAEHVPDAVRTSALASAAGLVIAGAVLVVAWRRTATVASAKEAFDATALGVAGLIGAAVVVGSGTLWFKRMVRMRQTWLLAPWLVADVVRRIDQEGPVRDSAQPVDDADEIFVVASELGRFHRPGCPIVAGLAVTSVHRGQLPAVTKPCDLCEAR